jgi:site-specific recombinase XerD
VQPPDEFQILIASWQLALEADGHPKTTRGSYGSGMRSLHAHLAELGEPPAPGDVTRAHVRGWMVALMDTHKQNTRRAWLAGVRHFWRWAVVEQEVEDDPTAGIKMPPPGEVATPVLADTEIRALLATAAGRSFVDRRDTAIIRLFFDAGPRIAELHALRVEDIDLIQRMAFVEGKGTRRSGPRRRALVYGVKTTKALDAYLRARMRHPFAERPELWLGDRNRGPVSKSGIEAVLSRRAKKAGIAGFHPHVSRHTWASEAKKAGVPEGDLMVLGGWRTRLMLDRYGAAEAAERAAESYRSRSFGDRI